jgi:hypothetical protein
MKDEGRGSSGGGGGLAAEASVGVCRGGVLKRRIIK